MAREEPTAGSGEEAQSAIHSRRSVLKAGVAVSAATLGVSSAGLGLAQVGNNITIDVNAEDEYVVINNTGDSAVDLTGYGLNFEASNEDTDQIRRFEGEVSIESGGSIVVPTGVQEVPNADVRLQDPYNSPKLNNENPDVVELVASDETVVATSNGDGGDTGGNGGDDDEGTEENTITVTVVDEETGNPIEGATVEGVGDLPGSAESLFEVETNSEGVAETTTQAVPYEVFVRAEGYNQEDTTVDLSNGDTAVTVVLTPANGDSDTDDKPDDTTGETEDGDAADDDCPEDEDESKESETTTDDGSDAR